MYQSNAPASQPASPADAINKTLSDLFYECQGQGVPLSAIQRLSALVGDGLFAAYNLGLYTPLRTGVPA